MKSEDTSKSRDTSTARRRAWTNRSVLALAGEADPVHVVTQKARTVVMEAIQAGWSGPPYDPFLLADHLKISVVARQDIPDARTVRSSSGFVVEFNPNRPRNRVKYSICHELAHTLFPDCEERVRHRLTHADMKGDDWQLETLCNIAAAEMLMPIGSIPTLSGDQLSIDTVLESRKRHEVSAEAVLLRAVRLTNYQCSIFCASNRQNVSGSEYVIDYAVASRRWSSGVLPSGSAVPRGSAIAECIAIGFTSKAHEDWKSPFGKVRVECLGVPPYPNQTVPRVLGIISPQRQLPLRVAELTYLQGDALRPRGTSKRIVTQIINDSAFTWGGGFSLGVRDKWPIAHDAFRNWATGDRRNLRLGNLHLATVDENLQVASLIAQRGYGPSPKPRIRYVHLRNCLEKLGEIARNEGASVHIPRIGCGQAGGSWSIVAELVEDALCSRGVSVWVYDLPGAKIPSPPQGSLKFAAAGA